MLVCNGGSAVLTAPSLLCVLCSAAGLGWGCCGEVAVKIKLFWIFSILMGPVTGRKHERIKLHVSLSNLLTTTTANATEDAINAGRREQCGVTTCLLPDCLTDRGEEVSSSWRYYNVCLVTWTGLMATGVC
jgi:hypothetical protein